MNVLIENYVKGLPRGNITNESECSICKVEFDVENRSDRKLDCSENCVNSIYHEDCIIEWIQRDPINHSKCMFCNKNINILIQYKYNVYKECSDNYIKNTIVLSLTSLVYDTYYLSTADKTEGIYIFCFFLCATSLFLLLINIYKLMKNVLYQNLPEHTVIFFWFQHMILYIVVLDKEILKNSYGFSLSYIMITAALLLNSVRILMKTHNRLENLGIN